MKRFFYLFICMAIFLSVMTGCTLRASEDADGSGENTGAQGSEGSDHTADLSPSEFETINDLEGVSMSVKEGTALLDILTIH